MYAVTLTKDGKVLKLVSFVNSKEEFEEIAQTLIAKYGEQWLIDNGYRLNLELAG